MHADGNSFARTRHECHSRVIVLYQAARRLETQDLTVLGVTERTDGVGPSPRMRVNIPEPRKVLAIYSQESPHGGMKAMKNESREPLTRMNRRTMLGTTTALIGGAIASAAAILS